MCFAVYKLVLSAGTFSYTLILVVTHWLAELVSAVEISRKRTEFPYSMFAVYLANEPDRCVRVLPMSWCKPGPLVCEY
jgi:hypothetical protein